jgi:tRNA uridine 5-carboxymethylaminomethyl modification enzyme
MDYGEPPCQSLSGDRLDTLVGVEVLSVLEPAALELHLSAASDVERERERLRQGWVNPRLVSAEQQQAIFGQTLERDYTLEELLRRPGITYDSLMGVSGAGPALEDPQVAEQVEIQTKYQGYIERQRLEVERQLAHETTLLPMNLDYREVRGLSIEVQQKLNLHRPETLGQAARISGITPAAISLLLVHLKRRASAQAGADSSEQKDGPTETDSAGSDDANRGRAVA